ncbi:MAG: DUF4040 domain-containing protein [Lachnospiraceae bacterium]|jgi:uncharacterized MnhB-related membrane protein|nr:DUF4040 domain-containing protein [Lachnospiraceae bacterium]
MTKAILLLLVLFLILCAVSAGFTKNLLVSIIIFMSYSLIMSIIWMFLEAPDLAITEAAVGAGVTSVLFFATLRRINAIAKQERKEEKHEQNS